MGWGVCFLWGMNCQLREMDHVGGVTWTDRIFVNVPQVYPGPYIIMVIPRSFMP